ncbi:MAG: divergent PAP2 family protein [Candidatus Komeilibacteria bacterium]|nr:divergent PAP2 family protein [Candidatus Komeilibacteria bacterium]
MKYFLIPLIISVIVHGIKLVLDIAKGRFSWHKAGHYGGMPSSHAALVTSLATIIYLNQGLSATFGLAVVLAIIVMRDAIGFRGYLSEHGRILNKLIKDLPDEEEYKYPVLQETIAHTWAQIAVGGLLGIILTLILFLTI